MSDHYDWNTTGIEKVGRASDDIALKHSDLSDNDRKDYCRVAVSAKGRFMRPDYSEQDCIVDTMSPLEAVFSCDTPADIGERIVAYLEHIGRIEGEVTEIGRQSFSISIKATDRKRDKLSAQLAWLDKKIRLGLPEDRRHERLAPSNVGSEIKLEDGRTFSCRIIDLSMSGAGIELDASLDIGTILTLGNMRGRIVRHFQEGVGIAFLDTQPEEVIAKLSWRGGIGVERCAA
jgi:hypothetical protein